MDISYYKKMEPFWGVWYIDKELGAGSFGKVFKIKREEFGKTYYSALKVISLPNDQGEVSSLKAEGMNEQSISDYYESFVMEIVEEYSLMAELKGHSNIVSYEDHFMRQHEDGVGYDVFIRMELLTPLNDYLEKEPFTEKNIIQIGIDICRALEVCGKQNIIHRDIKPENIFVSSFGQYKLGDFGVSRIAEGATQGMSLKGTISYMAPEVYKGQPYNSSVDIYSLGIVLYKLSNNNRGPFLPPAPDTIKHADRDRAENLRMNGTIFPDAVNASPELMAVIRKATAYNSKDRYTSAYEMRMDLEKIVNSESPVPVNNEPIKNVAVNNDIESTVSDKKVFRNKNRLYTICGVAAIMVATIIAIVCMLFANHSPSPEKTIESNDIYKIENGVLFIKNIEQLVQSDPNYFTDFWSSEKIEWIDNSSEDMIEYIVYGTSGGIVTNYTQDGTFKQIKFFGYESNGYTYDNVLPKIRKNYNVVYACSDSYERYECNINDSNGETVAVYQVYKMEWEDKNLGQNGNIGQRIINPVLYTNTY